MIIKETKGALDNFNVEYKDFKYDFGLGGIHGCISSGVYTSNNEENIESADVASYYPNIAIKNGIYPKHLSKEFCNVYQRIFEERRSSPKSSAKNKGLKLALNGVYGKSNDKYSFLYDPEYTMKTTINGQLLLCMLAERMQDAGFKMLMINTDGLECIVPKKDKHIYDSICQQWQNETKFELEFDTYKKLIIRDVNNYIGQFENGSLKHKGCFVYENLELHKNPSMKVVAFALEKYFVNNIPVKETIENHNDIYDFCCRFKATKGWIPHLFALLNNNINNEDIEFFSACQKTNRYYVSNKGYEFYKIHEDNRKIGIQKDWKIQLFNQFFKKDTIKEYDINYQFYIEECNKIINAIEN